MTLTLTPSPFDGPNSSSWIRAQFFCRLFVGEFTLKFGIHEIPVRSEIYIRIQTKGDL